VSLPTVLIAVLSLAYSMLRQINNKIPTKQSGT